MVDNNSKEQKEINVAPGKVSGTVYTQLVSVSVTDIDVTLEFIYVNPRNPSQGELVSRVTLPKNVAQDLSKTINLTLQSHAKKTSRQN